MKYGIMGSNFLFIHKFQRAFDHLSMCVTLQNISLQWRHDERDGVSNHQPHDYLLNCLFRHRSKKTSKLRFTGLCEGNSPVTDEFAAQRASYAENDFFWWRHHVKSLPSFCFMLLAGIDRSHQRTNLLCWVAVLTFVCDTTLADYVISTVNIQQLLYYTS